MGDGYWNVYAVVVDFGVLVSNKATKRIDSHADIVRIVEDKAVAYLRSVLNNVLVADAFSALNHMRTYFAPY